MKRIPIRSKRPKPALHVRFARGYLIALIVGIAVSSGAWYSDHADLDVLEEGNNGSRIASTLVIDLQATASVLGEIEDDPNSLVLRSDLARHSETIVEDWQALVGDGERPADISIILDGTGGLAAQMSFFLEDINALAAVGALGEAALAESDANAAGRLETTVRALTQRLEAVVGSYESVADGGIAGMRASSDFMLAVGVLFLLLLVGVLLRPLGHQLKQESTALREANVAHKAEARRQELATHLGDGLEAAETEEETQLVVERAFARLIPDHKVEMLISSSERGLLRSAVVHPTNGGPGCGVESPWSCPAVRRGRIMDYDDSDAINACPHLADREGGACAATCVPVSFMGQSMGVLHTTREVGTTLDRGTTEVLGLVASQVSLRLGTLRSFAQVELQASTDSLTGLPNRRATEDRLRRLLSDDDMGAVAMADLDRFKLLNDRYGHEAGDRALRMFADAVRESLRGDDWIGRWGGEEFLLIMPGLNVHEAKEALDRVRLKLADACVRAEAPAVTVSMGVVDTTAATAQDELVRLADDALLVAKSQGRDRVIPGPVLGPLPDPVPREGDEDLDEVDSGGDADDRDMSTR